MFFSLVVAFCAISSANAQAPSAIPSLPALTATVFESPSEQPSTGDTAVQSKPDDPPGIDASQKEIPKTDITTAPSTQAPSPIENILTLKQSFRLRGRIEAEAVWAAQSEQSMATIGDLQNGYGFRRVRLGAEGSVGDSTSWISEIEFAGNNVRLRDVFVALDALPGIRQLRIGHMREPYSLEGMTSSNFITFLERSPVNVLSPARNWGVCAYWWPDDERVLFTTGVFRDGTPNSGQSLGDGDNWALTTRLTALPIYEPNSVDFRLVHVGAAFSQRVPPDGVIDFSPRTGSNLLTAEDNPGSPFLPTVDIAANCYQLYNLQAASVWGPLSVQGEWSGAVVQQSNAPTLFVDGVYVYASYFLTGEHRDYNRTRGSFDQVAVLRPLIKSRDDPRSGFGAVELATRFSFVDFGSEDLPLDTNGAPAQTKLYQFEFGINWYLNTFTRIMANYTLGMPDKINFDSTNAHLFGIRTAIYW